MVAVGKTKAVLEEYERMMKGSRREARLPSKKGLLKVGRLIWVNMTLRVAY
jgi:hypothetical protein